MKKPLYTKKEGIWLPIMDTSGDRVERCVRWLNDHETMRWSEQRYREHDMESQIDYIASFIDEPWRHLWAIHNEGEFVGTISCYEDPRNRVANIGILVGDKRVRGKGIGTAAWEAVCDWAFSHGTEKVEAGCMAPNKAMLRIFEKTGMEIEGRIKNHFLLDGKPVDMILAGRVK